MQEILEAVHAAARPWIGAGAPAPGIPALARVDGASFGVALATVDGAVLGAGDWCVPFSAQSITKAFSLALVLSQDGTAAWGRVGHRPSSHRYNALSELEAEFGIPRNPFLNAGALAVVDRLLEITGGDACASVLSLLRTEAGNATIGVDERVVADELIHSDRNVAIAHLMAAFGTLRHPISVVMEHYVSQCGIAASCRDLALAGLFLARGGLRADGSRLLAGTDVRRLHATLLTCGMYGASAEIAHRIGLPAKSGVGGGVLAVVPGRGVLCAWSPGLDAAGNSIAAVAALEQFTSITGWSIF
ncbi:glutaminase [Allocatelliglobosispora scoriae]|uniref:Glutaminase n=1 Tax=Allocatelliglobosispora scoriae TaxID=643052 RepID=A0A841BM28_9ACTN|nr:glutaminase A [Allocatelliglobosispora scoriae]MBB5868249.1 glutaminase [Allocatelliglobosispora scoriae]